MPAKKCGFRPAFTRFQLVGGSALQGLLRAPWLQRWQRLPLDWLRPPQLAASLIWGAGPKPPPLFSRCSFAPLIHISTHFHASICCIRSRVVVRRSDSSTLGRDDEAEL